MDIKDVSVNWKKLQGQLKAQNGPKEKHSPEVQKRKHENISRSSSIQKSSGRSRKRFKHDLGVDVKSRPMQKSKQITSGGISTQRASSHAKDSINAGLSTDLDVGKYVAVDCEMVGVGPQPGPESALARVSIVNYDGEQIYDSYVKPKETVTDWRTYVSGIMPKHMALARSFEEVQQTVSDFLQDRILIGHSVSHDLNALLLSHPRRDIRDTARLPAYRRLAGGSSPRLKILASELLGVSIQAGEHSSIEDARACMLLFRRDKPAFEREHAKKFPVSTISITPAAGENGAAKKKKHKKKKKKK